VVRPTHAVRTHARSPASSAAPKSAAMSGLSAPAPAFLGAKPAQLSAGITAGRSGAGTRSVATMGLFGLGLPELVVIGGVAAVLFGPSKLPELGKSLGKTVKSFQAAANEFQDELKSDKEGEEQPPKQIEDGEKKSD